LLGCSVGTVKSQLARARVTLAAALGTDPDRDSNEEDIDAPE
jgi:DNA-directed RNA polymerase specialized sigma24 family protein